jgi:hypothetical protein
MSVQGWFAEREPSEFSAKGARAKCPFVRLYRSEQGDPRPLLPSALLRIVFKCREDWRVGRGQQGQRVGVKDIKVALKYQEILVRQEV